MPLGQAASSVGLGNLLSTKPSNTYLPAYPGAQGLQQQILQMLMGGGQLPGGGLGILGSMAGLGSGPSGMQRMGVGGTTPQAQTYQDLLPTLTGLATNNTAASGLAALQPVYQQNLNQASNQLTANAPGGRFSSGMLQAQGNLQSKSLNDFNLLAQNMMQQGIGNQLSAANTLGSLGGQANQAQMAALQALFGGSLGNAFGGNWLSQPSGLVQLMQILSGGAKLAGAAGG